MTDPPAPLGRYGADRAQIAELLAGTPRYRVDQLWSGLYQQSLPLESLTALPRALRESLADAFLEPPWIPTVLIQGSAICAGSSRPSGQ